MKPSDQT